MDAPAEQQCSAGSANERSGLNGPAMRTEACSKLTALRSFDEESDVLLHELNNVFVSILLNAQVMEWKLPSYSRMKRTLHEVQRNAQRGGELAKRLSARLATISCRDRSTCESETAARDWNAVSGAVMDQEPAPTFRTEEDVTVETPVCTAPAFPAISKKVPHTAV